MNFQILKCIQCCGNAANYKRQIFSMFVRLRRFVQIQLFSRLRDVSLVVIRTKAKVLGKGVSVWEQKQI